MASIQEYILWITWSRIKKRNRLYMHFRLTTIYLTMVLEINIQLSYEWVSGQGRWLFDHKSQT